MISLFKDREHQLKDHLSDIANKLDKPEDKWSFLYNYARKSLDEEISRFQRIDDKSVKLLSSVSIIITIFLALFKWILEDSNVEFSLYIYVILILIFLSLSCSWHFFFKALKLRLAPRMPLNDEIFKLVQEKNMATIHVALYKSCQKAVKESFGVIEDKAEQLKKGYVATSIAGFLLLLFVAMLSYEILTSNLTTNKAGDVIMSNEKSSNNQSPENDPDLDVTAPDPQLVTNDEKTPTDTIVIENNQDK